MRCPDTDYKYPANFNAVPKPPAATMLDMANQLIRMETRLVKLMYHLGLDANGRIREEN